KLKFLPLRIENVGADDVSRHQVGSELDALEGTIENAGQDADQERLGRAGNAFDQHMAAGEHAHQVLLDHFFLPDDYLGDLASGGLKKVRYAFTHEGTPLEWFPVRSKLAQRR